MGRSKSAISIYTHIHIYAPQDVCRKITTSTQGSGSDQLLYRSLYLSTNELLRAEANWLACRNSTTSVLTLGVSEILYQPISLFTYFYLHAVQNSFIYNIDYKLCYKPILIWRSTHDTELKITLGRVCIGLGCTCM